MPWVTGIFVRVDAKEDPGKTAEWRSAPKKETRNVWYVIQIQTGREEKVLEMIRTVIPREMYEECFYIRRECARKEGNIWRLQEAPLFPGYLFADTRDPQGLYVMLRQVPKLTKLLKEDQVFLGVSEEEQEFLEEIQSEGHVVKRSLVRLNEEKEIIWADGAVGRFFDHIVRQRIRKRYVLIEKELLGEKRKILFGIRTEEDELAEK